MAVWFRFDSDYDYRVPERNGRVTLSYKAGTTVFIPEAHAAAAEEAKAGNRTTKGKADASRQSS